MRAPMGSKGGKGKGGKGGKGKGGYDEGPPETVVAVGDFMHPCEGEAVCKLTNEKIPYFNGPIFLENKTAVGKVDEIFGPINQSMFTIKMKEGVVATSYSPGDKFYISPDKLLPLERFLPQPKGAPGAGGKGKGGKGKGGKGGKGGGKGGKGKGGKGGKGGGKGFGKGKGK